MTTRLDIRQSRLLDTLNQLINTTGAQGDTILRAINDELTPLLRLSATNSLTVTVSSAQTLNSNTNKNRNIPLVNGGLVTFAGGSITFPATSGGAIVFTGSTGATSSGPTVTCGTSNYVDVMFMVGTTGLSAIVGTAVGTTGALVIPVSSTKDIYHVGYIQLHNVGGTIQNVTQSDVYQFSGGGTNPHGITDHSFLQSNIITVGTTGDHVTMVGHAAGTVGVHGLAVVDRIAGTSDTQLWTNKSIVGGVASNSNRITFPKGTLAGMTGLTRKKGTFHYATDTQAFYYDDGANLVPHVQVSTPVLGSLTGFNGELVLNAGQRLSIEDTGRSALTSNIWVSVAASLNTGRTLQYGFGSPIAAVAAGGLTTLTTELYNGNTWVSSGNMISSTAIILNGGSCGIQNAGMATPGDPTNTNNTTQIFNGLAWTTGSAAATSSKDGVRACGTMNAAITVGGNAITGNHVVWKSLGWQTWALQSATTNVEYAMAPIFGNSNATIVTSGSSYSGSGQNAEYHNGITWALIALTNEGTLQTEGHGGAGGGTVTGNLIAGSAQHTEVYNGNTWSFGPTLVIGRDAHSGCGTQNSAIVYCGDTSRTTAERCISTASVFVCTRLTDANDVRTNIDAPVITVFTGVTGGVATEIAILLQNDMDKQQMLDQGHNLNTNWSMIGNYWQTSAGYNLNVPRYGLAGCGTQNAALSFGGNTGAVTGTTESFSGSTWTNTNLPCTAREGLAGCGTQNAAFSFGGTVAGLSVTTTEVYTPAGWHSASQPVEVRTYACGCGAQNAVLAFGGAPNNVSVLGSTFTFDGSSWTTKGLMILSRAYAAGCGRQYATLGFGGYTSSISNTTESFNGSTWTSKSPLNVAREYLAGCGTQNAALSFGGDTPSAVTESFNGATWTLNCNLNVARGKLAGSGTQNAALSFGGLVSATPKATTEKFVPNLETIVGSLNIDRFFYRVK